MTFPIGAPLARTTLPVTLLVYTLNGTMFAHPCDSADEHLAFTEGMREAYPNIKFTVYDEAVDDGVLFVVDPDSLTYQQIEP